MRHNSTSADRVRSTDLHLHLARARVLYEQAADTVKQAGLPWYLREHKYAVRLAKRTGYPLRLVCACLAIVSPRCQWSYSKRACEELLQGRNPPGIFTQNLAKASEVLASGNTSIDHNRSPKTWSFWQNLWRPNDPEPVTLDSWMFRIHDLPVTANPRAYHDLAAAYRELATELGLIPNQLQATVWLHARVTLRSRPQNGSSRKP